MEIKPSDEFWALLFWKEQSQIICGALMKTEVLAKSTGMKYEGNLYRQILSIAVGEESTDFHQGIDPSSSCIP